MRFAAGRSVCHSPCGNEPTLFGGEGRRVRSTVRWGCLGLLKEACRAEMAGTVGVETDALSATLTRAVP